MLKTMILMTLLSVFAAAAPDVDTTKNEAAPGGLPDPNGEFELCRNVCTTGVHGRVCHWRCY
ncbi:hypothetical protein SDRG_11666 [Saprolegnia diclina VS20]|uniref:Uncharacterized protein n=1 Tax=Saprolegnia diclina (strain VS20) TaxID=1156394 RepID=T0Q7L1_SAPDV|nr:hypothetical protein SDRG_11665 [Saprolegnia diclina VS20]XP_008615937.1 hypothetical protein SDRG_11666 [Saprolegnia diclina VS20]EQC30610.1 hypothetical protein SDRG_11665 [Saprolegnia diclina VS20]EQC30611.1 hypothetical protein SDRG_11666 [Saprolegnia diclina VS20]|eukprot:XP_008615936.1 hypothetical protein SDRG_11665 [Saprolegnia diclina VS20]